MGKNSNKNSNRGKNQNNPIIYESTTTMHTTTKTTVKVNNKGGNNTFESNLDFLQNQKLANKLRADRTEQFRKICNFFKHIFS